MISLPKPRGFWDYAFFALAMSGLLLFLVWLDATDGIGWRDAAVTFVAAVLFVLAITLARRNEKAAWMAQPTFYTNLLAVLGSFGLLFGAYYADLYLLHRGDITSRKLLDHVVFAVAFAVLFLWRLRKRLPVPADRV